MDSFICGGPETPTQKLVLATSKGYHGLLGYVKTVGNADILKRLNEAYEVKSVRYHRQCKCDLYNESVKVTTEATGKYILSFSFLLTQTLICHTLVAANAEKSQYRTRDDAVHLRQLHSVPTTHVLLFGLHTRMYAFFATNLLIFLQIIQVRYNYH